MAGCCAFQKEKQKQAHQEEEEETGGFKCFLVAARCDWRLLSSRTMPVCIQIPNLLSVVGHTLVGLQRAQTLGNMLALLSAAMAAAGAAACVRWMFHAHFSHAHVEKQ